MNDNPTFQIPKDVIEPIIKAHVSTAITAALGGQSQLVSEAVRQVLFQKVDSNGETDRYQSTHSIERIQWLAKDVITKAIRASLEEEIAKHRDRLKTEIVAALSKKNSPLIKQLAEGLVTSFADPATLKWRLSVTVAD
jgi:galactose-1-phosphate uridylyltransferase